jgi:hypothetical protein
MAKGNILFDQEAFSIWSTVGNGVGHCFEEFLLYWITIKINEPN